MKIKYFTILDENKVPTAFYTSDLHSSTSIPDTAIEVSETVYKKLVNGGKAFINNTVVDFVIELTAEEKAVFEITKLENMLTGRAKREAKRKGSKIIGYENGEIYCDDIEAEIERLEIEVLGR